MKYFKLKKYDESTILNKNLQIKDDFLGKISFMKNKTTKNISR